LFPKAPNNINISPRNLWKNNQNNTKAPTTIRKEPKTKPSLETIKSRMKTNPPSQVDPNTYIKISKKKDIFNYVKKSEKHNVRITNDGEIYELKMGNWTPTTKYRWINQNEIEYTHGGSIKIIPLELKKV